MNLLPKNIQNLIDELARLPGIGPKSAARIVFFLLKAPEGTSNSLSNLIKDVKSDVRICSNCFNFSIDDLCPICTNEERDDSRICVVEDALDLVAIEKAGVFDGLYHVLQGILSPMRGIGPDEIRLRELIERLKARKGSLELIMALNPDMEGEATVLFISREIEDNKELKSRVKITRLARGLATGSDIDYIDTFTLKKAFEGRTNL